MSKKSDPIESFWTEKWVKMLRDNSEFYHEFYHEMSNKCHDQNSWQSRNHNGITMIEYWNIMWLNPGRCTYLEINRLLLRRSTNSFSPLLVQLKYCTPLYSRFFPVEHIQVKKWKANSSSLTVKTQKYEFFCCIFAQLFRFNNVIKQRWTA